MLTTGSNGSPVFFFMRTLDTVGFAAGCPTTIEGHRLAASLATANAGGPFFSLLLLRTAQDGLRVFHFQYVGCFL